MKKTKFIFLLAFGCFTVALQAAEDRSFHINKNLNLFNSISRELDLNYVDTLDYDKNTRIAIEAMLRQLDPYTVYIAEEQTDDLTFMTTGQYAGIGAVIAKGKEGIYIADPYEGKPAQKNGLKAGDIILAVDGDDVTQSSVGEVSAKLKGVPNTSLKLKIQRPGDKKPFEKTFLREKIQLDAVSYTKVFDGKTGYLLLNDFTDHAASELRNTVSSMIKNDSIEALIIDLRNNGGGLIDEAVKILGFFLPKGTNVVSTRGKTPASERSYRTPSQALFPNMKLCILTNSASASASEIIAGAVQDLDRGIVIGERTFGKGLVQSIRPLNYGGHLKITTAKYYIPSGRCIQAIDYSHRNEDGSVGPVPDSLTSVFHTRNGRPVRDGGGITPDIRIEDNRKMNIAYYIYAQNLYFDYATLYAQRNKEIASLDSFELSDEIFEDFCAYLLEKKFSYTSQTEKYFEELKNLARYEGLEEAALEEFEALKKKLSPDISESMRKNKAEITRILGAEIVKRYYFQKGEIAYSLRNDPVLERAKTLLKDSKAYTDLLQKK